MDTTLRDGEQTSGVSFMPHEKLVIARALLQHVNVDRIEVASARVSEGELEAVKSITRWARQAGRLDSVEVLGFVDGTASVDWIVEAGGCRLNLLCKGSLKHCTGQLKKSPEEHIADIRNVVAYAQGKGVGVNLYLEDWSRGMKESPEYVYQMVDALQDAGIDRFMLPDTLGILNPLDLISYMRLMRKRYPTLRFDFHAHNDYDLAISNVLAAGRMTSARGRGWDIMRNIPACVMTGEASGTAAALAVKNGCTLQELNVKELQDTLEKAGVKLHRKPECEGNINLPKPPKKPVERKEGEPNISMTSMVHFESSDTKISGRH